MLRWSPIGIWLPTCWFHSFRFSIRRIMFKSWRQPVWPGCWQRHFRFWRCRIVVEQGLSCTCMNGFVKRPFSSTSWPSSRRFSPLEHRKVPWSQSHSVIQAKSSPLDGPKSPQIQFSSNSHRRCSHLWRKTQYTEWPFHLASESKLRVDFWNAAGGQCNGQTSPNRHLEKARYIFESIQLQKRPFFADSVCRIRVQTRCDAQQTAKIRNFELKLDQN